MVVFTDQIFSLFFVAEGLRNRIAIIDILLV
jgi:hypothetical protein